MKLEQTLGQVTKLKNGLTVIYVPFPGLQSAYIYFKGRAGADAEKSTEIGTAHFLEHLCFDGTEKFPTANAVTKFKEKYGAYSNAGTNRPTVSFYFKCLKNDMEAGFDYISQLTLHPLIKDEDVEKEREIIIQELQAKGHHHTKDFSQGVYNLSFPGKQRVKLPVTGRPQHVRRITRKILTDFMKRNYVANNFYLAVCADASLEKIEKLAEKYLGEMKSGKRFVPKPVKRNESFGIFVRNKKDRKQARIYIEFWAYEYNNKNRIPLSMGAVILRKRLFKYMRISQGFIYDVSCSTSAAATYGDFSIYTKTGLGNATTAIKIIKDHIEDIVQNGITEEEYKIQQKYEETSYIFGAENPEDRAEFYANIYCNDHFAKSHTEMQKIIKETTIKDINKTLKEVLTAPPRISVAAKSLTENDVRYAWFGETQNP
jgi:predicted Zn-dependent peptidase